MTGVIYLELKECYLYLASMKKLLLTIFAFIYLVMSTGLTVNYHYCMEKLVSSSLFSVEETICSFCGMHKEDTKGCCKDEHRQIKLKDMQQLTDSFSFFFNYPIIHDVSQVENYSFYTSALTILTKPVSHAPPGSNLIPFYIRNCVFRI